MPKLILSPVGTSLFTNLAGDNRSLINENANALETEINEETKNLINDLEKKAQALFKNSNSEKLKQASAELNSLLTLYDNRFEGHQRDTHVLIATDTFLGKAAADLLKSYLDTYFDSVMVIQPQKLSTKTKDHFHSGIRNLLKWCDKNLNDYKDAGFEIIFNLTGGFKSLQGYLNTIGMFYADKIIYIFERANELITIPRLPIKIEAKLFEEYAALFLQLSQTTAGIEHAGLVGLPEMMIEAYDKQKYILSDWGELSWNKAKEQILSQRLIELLFIIYSDSFKRDFQNTNRPKDKVSLQEILGFISCRLQENNGNITCLKGGRSGGILYDNYSGNNSHIGHFRINQGLRVTCSYKDNELLLRHYGVHDYVNDNP